MGLLEERVTCWPWSHRWSAYEEPRNVTGSAGECAVGQRRVCSRCNAVDYRRVMIHN